MSGAGGGSVRDGLRDDAYRAGKANIHLVQLGPGDGGVEIIAAATDQQQRANKSEGESKIAGKPALQAPRR